MPRFFFHVHDGKDVIDTDGSDFPDWPAARIEAVQLAGALIREDAASLAVEQRWAMAVADESGRILLRIDFSLATDPALG